MRILLTRTTFLTTAALITAAAISLGGGVPAAVHYIGHEKVTEVMCQCVFCGLDRRTVAYVRIPEARASIPEAESGVSVRLLEEREPERGDIESRWRLRDLSGVHIRLARPPNDCTKAIGHAAG
jgi:hypothetical protein